MQRARVLDAMVAVADERGFAGASVGLVATTAGVSRRTFYELFDGLQDCFEGVLEDAAGRVMEIVARAFVGRETWSEGLRWALASLLVFFEAEPLLARVWLVESMTAGAWAIEYRERRLRELLLAISEAWPLPEGYEPMPLATEGVFAAVRSIVVQRVIDEREQASLIELLGPLMGMVATPFLGESGARLEIERGDALARSIAAGDQSLELPGRPHGGRADILTGVCGESVNPAVSTLLREPRAYRARLCLRFLSDYPGASNSEIAAGIGVRSKGQISALLSRMARQGLVLKVAGGPGERNEWRLAADGESASAALRAMSGHGAIHRTVIHGTRVNTMGCVDSV